MGFDLLHPNQEVRVKQKLNHAQHATARQFSVGDAIMAKNVRPGSDWVPATVKARLGPLSYRIETADGQLWRRHIAHLKGGVNKPLFTC